VLLAPELAPGNVDGLLVFGNAGGGAVGTCGGVAPGWVWGATPPGTDAALGMLFSVPGDVVVLELGDDSGAAPLLGGGGLGVAPPGAVFGLVPGVVSGVIVPEVPAAPVVPVGFGVVGVPGVVVPDVPPSPGVVVPGTALGAVGEPGTLVVVSGTAPCASGPTTSVCVVNLPVGGGGPASGRLGGGGTFLLAGSASGPLPGGSAGCSCAGVFGGMKFGVASFRSGAPEPNGLR
jgi:hypothetical protein